MGLFLWDSEPSKIFVGDTPISKVFLWDTQVRPSGWWGWQPWANTIAYYPLTSTTTTSDESGNGNTLTNRNVSFWTYQWVSCASFNGSSSRLNSTIAETPQWAAVRTVLWYCYNNHATYTEGTDEIIFVSWQTGSTWKMFKVAVYNDNNWIQQRWDDYEFSQTIREQRWCGAVVYDGTKFTFYVNWVSQWDWTNTPVTSWTSFYIGWSNKAWWRWSGYISNVIFENKAWTAQEITDYYNSTKSNYWL